MAAIAEIAAILLLVDDRDYFVSGQPESLAAGKALSPGTTVSCL
jgi:hypothetical protein